MSLERVVTVAILVFSMTFLFLIMPEQVEAVSYGRIIPATLPTILLWIIAAAAAVQLVTLKDNAGLNSRVLVRAIIALTLMAIAAYLMDIFAFEYVAPILALLLMLFSGETRWYWLILGGIAVPLGIWLLVEQVLNRALA